jgi:hypothetical protein
MPYRNQKPFSARAYRVRTERQQIRCNYKAVVTMNINRHLRAHPKAYFCGQHPPRIEAYFLSSYLSLRYLDD